MNLVDSSCWLEYFAGTTISSKYAKPIEDVARLVVPTISLFEVFKKVLSQRDETSALQAIAQMRQGTVIDLTESIALNAASLSVQLNLPLADSIILATARETNATLWTQDADFH